MFGYVVPTKSELKIREFEIYNSYYCAVCHSIRDRYGQLPRLLLTFDSVFLAMLLSSPDEKQDELGQFRCMTHPTRIRNIVSVTPEIDYAADMMILLGYYNLKDDYEDERSIVGLTGSAYLKRAYRKINLKYPEKSELIGAHLRNLSETEKKGSSIFDEVAEPFAKLMEELFDYKSAVINESDKARYRSIGFHLGKWIYLLDAFDDLEKDIKKKNYNPLIRQFGFAADDHEGEILDDFKKRINERIGLNLELYLANIGKQMDDLPLIKNKEILENIVYLGLRGKTDEILDRKEELNESI